MRDDLIWHSRLSDKETNDSVRLHWTLFLATSDPILIRQQWTEWRSFKLMSGVQDKKEKRMKETMKWIQQRTSEQM